MMRLAHMQDNSGVVNKLRQLMLNGMKDSTVYHFSLFWN